MQSHPLVVLVFEADHSVRVYASTSAAEGGVEAVDVSAGEYPAIFTDEGRAVAASVQGDDVIMTISDRPSFDDLLVWLAQLVPPVTDVQTPEDVRRFANAVLRDQWERSGPTRPRWLHRRLYGSAPRQV